MAITKFDSMLQYQDISILFTKFIVQMSNALFQGHITFPSFLADFP